jgi:hypothetical protein
MLESLLFQESMGCVCKAGWTLVGEAQSLAYKYAHLLLDLIEEP